jgi:TetR/AcrR family fatty acid metabolism transcriptional regulator
MDEPPGELSSHDRILQAARRLFATDGYENTTTSAIARKAGTSESQLIKHFGSKEGLLESIFDQAWQRMGAGIGQVLERPESLRERLQNLTELMISALERDKELRTLMLLEGRRIRRHGHMVVLTRGFLQVLGALDGMLRELQARGELREGLNVEAVRAALVGAFEGLLRDQVLAERMDFPARYDGTELRAAFRAVLDCFFETEQKGQQGQQRQQGQENETT